MPARVRVICPHCGDQWIGAHRVTLTERDGWTYAFFCYGCGNVIARRCSAHIVSLLESVGVFRVRLPDRTDRKLAPLTAAEVEYHISGMDDELAQI